MSLECSICEHDARGPHDPSCPRATDQPSTASGRALDSATFHSPTCDKSALMDGLCTCGFTALIVDCEAEARADTARPVEDLDNDADHMCPNCVTPWKCNGPHLIEQTPYSLRQPDASSPEFDYPEGEPQHATQPARPVEPHDWKADALRWNAEYVALLAQNEALRAALDQALWGPTDQQERIGKRCERCNYDYPEHSPTCPFPALIEALAQSSDISALDRIRDEAVK